MSESLRFPRRTFLRGLGTAVALPMLAAMLPLGTVTGSAFAAEGKKKRVPNRLAFFYVPNGVHMAGWTPKATGGTFEVPPILTALKPFKGDLLLLSGLTQDKARPNGDGPGDHARAAAAFLTGCQPRKTGGANIRVGVSADQQCAARVGTLTRFASLELGCEEGSQSGNCDSGYSCAYSNNISWKSESQPMSKEVDPRLLFERLFPSIATKQGKSSALYNRSIIDFVLEDASLLRGKLGATDQRKLDEYLGAIREIEGRLARAEKEAKERKAEDKPSPELKKTAETIPPAIPSDYGEHIRLMGDLLVLAFQADLTRVATFMFANEGSNRSYKHIDVPEGHHDLSHHGNENWKQEKVEKINRFHVEQFAYVLKKLKAVREGAGTLLDNSMIVYGSGISDGNRHNHDELPILVAGKGGGTLKTGRHVRYPKNTPLNNLYLTLLDRMEAKEDRLGDSTGRVGELA
jgi:hypothetical protein